MRRRDVGKVLLASAVVPAVALVARRAEAQSSCSTPPCYPLFGNETTSTVVDYTYPPGNVKRYGAVGGFASPSTVDDGPAIQNAIDSGAGVVYFPNGIYRVGAPLRIRPDSGQIPGYTGPVGTQNLTFVGEGRTNSYLAPLSANITDSLGVNALIVNQANNGKFSISNLRFWADVAYTGIAIYAVEGGAAGTGQAIFSGSIDNCWFELSSNASGVFRGALNNYRVSNCAFEFMKGCFYREGNGMGDVIFSNNVMCACYDAFYDGMTDTIGDNLITIDGLHVYIHQRGQVIQTQNSVGWTVRGVMVQAATSPIAGVGLFKLVNCENVICTDFTAVKITQSGGSGPIGEAITISGSRVKLANGIIDGADFGIRVTGNGAVTLTVDNVDILNSALTPFAVQNGTPPGRVTVNNCNWSNSNGNLLTFTSAAAFDLVVTNCRLMNAGLTTAAARNISIATSGNAVFESCVIGRDTGSALASYYVNAAGSGTLTFRRPTFTGTAPTAIKIGSQTAFAVNDPPPTTL
jgi:hypothetical protein